MNKRTIAIFVLIAIAIATRIIPHVPNFTAVGAAALLGGVLYKNLFKAILIPVTALFLSDLIINNIIYSEYVVGFQWFTVGFGFIYAGFILTVLMGRYFTKGFRVLPLAGTALLSTITFYLITNFGAWLASPLYPQNLSGLLGAYAAGIPFLAWELLGTFFYGSLLFGAAWFLVGQREQAKVYA